MGNFRRALRDLGSVKQFWMVEIPLSSFPLQNRTVPSGYLSLSLSLTLSPSLPFSVSLLVSSISIELLSVAHMLIFRSFRPDFVLVRQSVRGIGPREDHRNILLGLQFGNVPSINSLNSIYNFAEKPWVVSMLMNIFTYWK